MSSPYPRRRVILPTVAVAVVAFGAVTVASTTKTADRPEPPADRPDLRVTECRELAPQLTAGSISAADFVAVGCSPQDARAVLLTRMADTASWGKP